MNPFRWVDLLTPGGTGSHEAARSSRLVVRVALLTLSVCVLMQGVYFADGAHLIAQMVWLSILLQVLGLVLHRVTGSYKVGGHAHCLSLWVLFFGISAISGGIDSPNLVANILVAVLAPMLLGRRHGLLWLVVVVLTYVAQFQLTAHGLVQQTIAAADLQTTRLTELAVTSATTGLTAYFFAKGEERMRARLAAEKHLVEGVNTDLRVILDNAGQGFLSLDLAGRVTGERSAVVDTWLGGLRVGTPFWIPLATLDPRVAARFESEWGQIEEGFLPLELCLAQLPALLVSGETTYRLEYRAVRGLDDAVEKFVVIISDISAEVARAEAEIQQRDLLEAFGRIVRDREGFASFLVDARRGAEDIIAGKLSLGDLKRRLHTLKGNSAMMGLSGLARACHELEDELDDEGASSEGALSKLDRELRTIEARLRPFLAIGSNEITLNPREYAEFLRALASRAPHSELLRLARKWPDKPVARHLERLADYALKLCERLGKGSVEVRTEGGELRMPERATPFWDVAVHVVRNAVDHGLESVEERRTRGKGVGKLRIQALASRDRPVVEISDDGRGIDWQRIRELATERGIPAASEQDLVAALFADGLSTSRAVSDTSGRGVGMSGVRDTCASLDIAIQVHSTPGAGTTFRFEFPDTPPDVGQRASLHAGRATSVTPRA